MDKIAEGKVYVVTSGEYSDYRIVGIYSTEDKAQRVMDADRGDIDLYDEYRIEEWDIDEIDHSEYVLKTGYYARIKTENGDIYDSGQFERYVKPNARIGSSWDDIPDWSYKYNHTQTAVSYISSEHAVKLAVEYRQTWLRKTRIETEPSKD